MAIRVRILFEVMGWPKEALNPSLKQTIDVLRNNKWKILKEEYAEPTPLYGESENQQESPINKAEMEKIVDLQTSNNPAAKEQLKKSKMYSSFVEFEGEVKTLSELFAFAINFAPSAIEILEPFEFESKAGDIQDIIADVCGKIRSMDKDLKLLAAEHKLMRNQLQTVIGTSRQAPQPEITLSETEPKNSPDKHKKH